MNAAAPAAPLLTLQDVHAGYATSTVLAGVSLEVREGEVVCLLGRNGAGKTTTIRAISGLLPPRSGSVTISGTEVSRSSPMAIVGLGLAVVPEGRRVFKTLSVEENLYIGAYSRRTGVVPKADLERVFTLFPRLAERRTQLAGTMSGGEQQMLAMGRALMASPRIMLLDEPSMGLAPLLIELVFKTIDALARQGITILLVEQNAAAALDVADRAYVLERGRVVLHGTAAELEQTQEVRQAYLGH